LIEKKNKLISTAKEQETCVLVGVVTREQSREQLTEYLDELAFLAETANARCLKRFTQNLDRPDTTPKPQNPDIATGDKLNG
jgi:GTP-binding protein HflX